MPHFTDILKGLTQVRIVSKKEIVPAKDFAVVVHGNDAGLSIKAFPTEPYEYAYFFASGYPPAKYVREFYKDGKHFGQQQFWYGANEACSHVSKFTAGGFHFAIHYPEVYAKHTFTQASPKIVMLSEDGDVHSTLGPQSPQLFRTARVAEAGLIPSGTEATQIKVLPIRMPFGLALVRKSVVKLGM